MSDGEGMTLEEIEAELLSKAGPDDYLWRFGPRCEALRAARAYIQRTGCVKVFVQNEQEQPTT